MMVDQNDPAFVLARLRASSTFPIPQDSAVLNAWDAAAARAGRRLVDVTGHSRSARLALGWAAGAEPFAGGESGVIRAAPSRTLLLVFAAAVRACWPDRSEPIYPGAAAKEADILAAVAALGPLTSGASDPGASGERHHKGALRRLYECGLLETTGPDGRDVRLGPMVGLWSEAEAGALRAVYDQLPPPPPPEESAGRHDRSSFE